MEKKNELLKSRKFRKNIWDTDIWININGKRDKRLMSNNEINLSYVRVKKRHAMSQAYKRGITRKEERLKIEMCDDAVILPYYIQEQFKICGGGVFDKNGKLIPISKINATTPVGNFQEEFIFSDEIVVYCGGCRPYAPHWGHFLIDVVSRLWYVLSKNVKSDVKYIIVGTEGKDYKLDGNFLEFLRLMGIEDKVQILKKATKFKRVIIPEKSYDFDLSIKKIHDFHYYSKEYLETFDYVVKKALDKQNNYDIKESHKKIYLIRNDARDVGFGYC